MAEELKDAAGFGWSLGEGQHDWSTLVKNKVWLQRQTSGKPWAFQARIMLPWHWLCVYYLLKGIGAY